MMKNTKQIFYANQYYWNADYLESQGFVSLKNDDGDSFDVWEWDKYPGRIPSWGLYEAAKKFKLPLKSLRMFRVSAGRWQVFISPQRSKS